MGEQRRRKIFGLERDQLARLFSLGIGNTEQPESQTGEPMASECANAGAASEAPDFAAAFESSLEQVGSWVGPYRLVSVLGEGGMGTAFLADQIAPLRRRVTLKVIKPGMDSKRVIARFEAERQALARASPPMV